MISCFSKLKQHIMKTSHKFNPIISPNSILCSPSNTLFNNNCKRLWSSFHHNISGSLTIEASLAIPIFLFFIANLLSLFITFENYTKTYSELHQNIKTMAMTAHLEGSGLGDEMIDLSKWEAISPLFDEISFMDSNMHISLHARKWTGYDNCSFSDFENDEEYVYITESGSAYHRSRDCSHLKVHIRVINNKDLSSARNADGSRYSPCEKCAKTTSSGLYFITDYGNKYHTSATCSSLKRSIQTVPISQVNGRYPCSSCAY